MLPWLFLMGVVKKCFINDLHWYFYILCKNRFFPVHHKEINNIFLFYLCRDPTHKVFIVQEIFRFEILYSKLIEAFEKYFNLNVI